MRLSSLFFALTSVALSACGVASNEAPSSDVKNLNHSFATPVRPDPYSCSEHVANAGSVFTCPANTFVAAIHDRQEIFGRFETVTCCALRNPAGWHADIVWGSYRLEPTQYGTQRTCSGHHLLKGVQFDNNGSAVAMACYRARVGGMQVSKAGWGAQMPLYAHGSASCPYNMVGTGLGDNITADGVIDNLRCQPLAAY